MGKFNLSQTFGTDIATTFRYMIEIDTNKDSAASQAGLNKIQKYIEGYSVSAELPCAPGQAIEWAMPMGMINHQAGKRKTKEISLEFVIPTNGDKQRQGTLYMLENWSNNCYNLNRGTNTGKANYCTDAIQIKLMTERDAIAYTFHLLRAQPTNINYGTVNSEGNDLIKVSMSLVYDNYKLYSGADGLPLNEDSSAYS
jgi:hypothetical protein